MILDLRNKFRYSFDIGNNTDKIEKKCANKIHIINLNFHDLSFFSRQIQRGVEIQNLAVLPTSRDNVAIFQNTYGKN